MLAARRKGSSTSALGLPEVLLAAILEFSDLAALAASAATATELSAAQRQCRCSVLNQLLCQRSPRTAQVLAVLGSSMNYDQLVVMFKQLLRNESEIPSLAFPEPTSTPSDYSK